MGRSDGKRLIGIRRRRWEDNIKVQLMEIRRCKNGSSAYDRDKWRAVMNTVLNPRLVKYTKIFFFTV